MPNVVVYVNNLSSSSIPVEIAAHTAAKNGVNITLVSHYDSEDTGLDPDIENLSIPTILLDGDSRTDLSSYHTLRNICESNEVDILHTHHNSTGSLGRIATSGTNTKVVSTLHTNRQALSSIQRLIGASTYPRIDAIIANSRSTLKSLNGAEILLSGNSLRKVIYNGIDISRIENSGSESVHVPEEPNIISIGRLEPIKNHRVLLKAFKKVREEIPECTLTIVGDGSLRENLERLADSLGIADSVVFTGYLSPRESVYSALEQSSIAVFPSLNEGFCVAAVEAMACEIPVVASDIDVFHEIIGDVGLFANPEDPLDFADKTVHILQDTEKRSDLKQQSAIRAREEFPIRNTAQQYAKLYRNL